MSYLLNYISPSNLAGSPPILFLSLTISYIVDEFSKTILTCMTINKKTGMIIRDRKASPAILKKVCILKVLLPYESSMIS